MAFREVRMFEVREVLRLWLRDEGIRPISQVSQARRMQLKRSLLRPQPRIAAEAAFGKVDPSRPTRRCCRVGRSTTRTDPTRPSRGPPRSPATYKPPSPESVPKQGLPSQAPENSRDRSGGDPYRRGAKPGRQTWPRRPERSSHMSTPHRQRSPEGTDTRPLQRARRRDGGSAVVRRVRRDGMESVEEWLDRLDADREVVYFLQLSGFDESTDEWQIFASALIEYGYAVFRAWFATGEIVARLARRGVLGRAGCPAPGVSRRMRLMSLRSRSFTARFGPFGRTSYSRGSGRPKGARR